MPAPHAVHDHARAQRRGVGEDLLAELQPAGSVLEIGRRLSPAPAGTRAARDRRACRGCRLDTAADRAARPASRRRTSGPAPSVPPDAGVVDRVQERRLRIDPLARPAVPALRSAHRSGFGICRPGARASRPAPARASSACRPALRWSGGLLAGIRDRLDVGGDLRVLLRHRVDFGLQRRQLLRGTSSPAAPPARASTRDRFRADSPCSADRTSAGTPT